MKSRAKLLLLYGGVLYVCMGKTRFNNTYPHPSWTPLPASTQTPARVPSNQINRQTKKDPPDTGHLLIAAPSRWCCPLLQYGGPWYHYGLLRQIKHGSGKHAQSNSNIVEGAILRARTQPPRAKSAKGTIHSCICELLHIYLGNLRSQPHKHIYT